MQITIETKVAAPVGDVWQAWTTPADIRRWNAASDDWRCPRADVDLRVGGRFSYRMEARDGSASFDFVGTFTRVVPNEAVEFELEDGRPVTVRFEPGEGGVMVRETFDAESELSGEQQRQGWQAILERFARHVEAKVGG